MMQDNNVSQINTEASDCIFRVYLTLNCFALPQKWHTLIYRIHKTMKSYHKEENLQS